MKRYIARSKNGIRVYVDLLHSHAATHLKEEPKLLAAAKAAIRTLNLKEDNIPVEVDMGYTVGKTSLVKTTSKDEIIYAKRLHRDNYTRFAKNRQPADCSTIALILKRAKGGKSYELFSTWVGTLTPTFPGSDYETPGSIKFWAKHALVWGREPVQPQTITVKRPW